LERLALEHTKKKFRGDKKKRWQHIQKELGLADRSFKSCQRAFRAVAALQRASAAALDAFDASRRQLAKAKTHHAACLAYEISCDNKALEASQRITTQSTLDRELRLTAHLTRGEHDMEGRPRALALLLSRGADPDAADSGGFSALMAAARTNACAAVDVLLDHGATIDLADADGHAALYHALEGGAAQAAQLLMRRGAAHGNSSDHTDGLEYGALVGEQIEKFVASERQARDKAERERRWFVSFEERHAHQKCKGRRAGNHSARHHPTNRLTLRSLKQWPPKLPPSRRRAKRGGGADVGDGGGGGGDRSSRNGTSRLSSGGRRSSRHSSSAHSQHHSGTQLTAPTALDALRLGLEGSRQRKDRLQREGNEVVRQQARDAADAARPPTYERNMMSAQGHTAAALTGVAEDLEGHREALHRARASDMHRANTAAR
jgi:ankyrin repeat protein